MTRILILAAALLALLWWKRPRREFVGTWLEQDAYDAWLRDWAQWAEVPRHVQ